MIDVSALRMLLLTVTTWLDGQEREILAYLIEENRVLRRQLDGRRSSARCRGVRVATTPRSSRTSAWHLGHTDGGSAEWTLT